MDQESIPVYEVNFKVHSYLLDPAKRLSIPGLLWLFGEAAHYDAGRRGWGYQEMTGRNQAWVLIRVLIEVIRMPVWEENILLKTWPRSMEGAQALRDFQVFDQSGKLLVAGTTVWSLIDLEKRKPVRMSGTEYHTGSLAGRKAIDRHPNRILWTKNLQTAGIFKARFCQLDMNLHVNNARYLEWVLNELPIEVLLNRNIRSIELNFLSEVMPDEEVEVLTGLLEQEPLTYEGVIRRIPDYQPVFATRLGFI